MKQIFKLLIINILCLTSLSCTQDIKPLTETEKNEYLDLGNTLSDQLQKELLENVSKAIQQGGTDYAVNFCNVKAIPITNSFSESYKIRAQRLSDKNRNPQNAIQTQEEFSAWEKIKREKSHFVEQNAKGDVYYYKPIAIKMPTCLQCHGTKENISESTLKILTEKYPNDKATGYQMNNMRGMWKLKLK